MNLMRYFQSTLSQMRELKLNTVKYLSQITQLANGRTRLETQAVLLNDLRKNFWGFLIITLNLSTRIVNINDQSLNFSPDSVLRGTKGSLIGS